MKNKFILILIIIISATAFIQPALAKNGTFSDVKNDAMYASAAEGMAYLKVVSGNKGKFEPNKKITRAEAAKILLLLSGNANVKYKGKNNFIDVSQKDWYNAYANFAYSKSIISGTLKNKKRYFLPNSNVTYAEFVTMALRMMGYKSLKGTWPKNYMLKSNEQGLTKNLTNVKAEQPLKRGEAAIIGINILSAVSFDTKKLYVDSIAKSLGIEVKQGVLYSVNSTAGNITLNIDQKNYSLVLKNYNSNQQLLKKITFYLKGNYIFSLGNAIGDVREITISSVKDNKILYTNQLGLEDTLNISSNLKLIVNGKNAAISELKPMMKASISDLNDDGKYDVVEAHNMLNIMTVTGTVSSKVIDGNGNVSVTIQGKCYKVKNGIEIAAGYSGNFIIQNNETIIMFKKL